MAFTQQWYNDMILYTQVVHCSTIELYCASGGGTYRQNREQSSHSSLFDWPVVIRTTAKIIEHTEKSSLNVLIYRRTPYIQRTHQHTVLKNTFTPFMQSPTTLLQTITCIGRLPGTFCHIPIMHFELILIDLDWLNNNRIMHWLQQERKVLPCTGRHMDRHSFMSILECRITVVWWLTLPLMLGFANGHRLWGNTLLSKWLFLNLFCKKTCQYIKEMNKCQLFFFSFCCEICCSLQDMSNFILKICN